MKRRDVEFDTYSLAEEYFYNTDLRFPGDNTLKGTELAFKNILKSCFIEDIESFYSHYGLSDYFTYNHFEELCHHLDITEYMIEHRIAIEADKSFIQYNADSELFWSIDEGYLEDLMNNAI